MAAGCRLRLKYRILAGLAVAWVWGGFDGYDNSGMAFAEAAKRWVKENVTNSDDVWTFYCADSECPEYSQTNRASNVMPSPKPQKTRGEYYKDRNGNSVQNCVYINNSVYSLMTSLASINDGNKILYMAYFGHADFRLDAFSVSGQNILGTENWNKGWFEPTGKTALRGCNTAVDSWPSQGITKSIAQKMANVTGQNTLGCETQMYFDWDTDCYHMHPVYFKNPDHNYQKHLPEYAMKDMKLVSPE